jgi:ABC-type multidrug transport system fused ATPase/permease subunit
MTAIQLLRQVLLSRLHFRFFILLSSLAATTLGLLGPFFQKEYLDLLLGHEPLWTLVPLQGPPWVLMIYSFFCILGYLGFSQLTNFLGAREAIIMQGELSQKLYRQALLLRGDGLQGKPIGEMVAVYATDVAGSTFLLEQSIPTGASIVFPLVLAPWVLYRFFGVPLTALLGMLGVISILNFTMAFRQSDFFFLFKKLAADRIGLVNEWIQNIRTLRILGWIRAFEERIYDVRVRETKNRISMVTNGQAMNSVASSITFILNIAVVLTLMASSETPVSAGTLFALLWIVGVFLTRPFRQMPWVFTFIFDAWTSIRRLSDFLSLKNIEASLRPTEFKKIHEITPGDPALLIENLNLKIGQSEILKSVSFHVNKGEFVAIVGEVGSGKTSLLLSLMGETGAQFDRYLINGNQGTELPLPQLRQFFTFVPQEGFIMSASLRENVAFEYALSPSKDLQLLESLKRSQFDLHTERVESGLDTEIGERGVNLSGGQKQRVSLARVDYHQSPFVLMDDCLSAVDVDTEEKLIASLLKGAWKNRTRLLVTHRLSVLDEVDRILFFDHGKIIAEGTLESLLKGNLRFQAFVASVTKRSADGDIS